MKLKIKKPSLTLPLVKGGNSTFRFVPSDKSDGNKERVSELGFVGLKDYRNDGMLECWKNGRQRMVNSKR